MANEVIDFYIAVVIFLIISFIFTQILKRFVKMDTFFIFSLLKTKRPLWIFDRLAFLGKKLDTITEIGLVLGFGALSVDYLVGKKREKGERVLLFLGSTIFLTLLFIGFDLLVGRSFSDGFLTKDLFYPIAFLFGLFGFSGFVIAILVINAVTIIAGYITGTGACPGIAPVLPGVEVPNVPISIPLYAWIPLLLTVAIHELMHGVVARKENIPVKSTGILLLGFLPMGGFVEPDEEVLMKADDRKQLHVFAAGVVTNIIAFIATFIAIAAIVIVLTATLGPWAQGIAGQSVAFVQIDQVSEKITFCKTVYPSPAFGTLETGMTIKEINGKTVSHTGDVSAEIAATRHSPITLLVEKDGTEQQVTLSPNALGSFGFGLENVPNENFTPPTTYKIYSLVVGSILGFANWFLLFNLLLGMMNYLPFPILDGGRIAPIMLSEYVSFGKSKKETEKMISKIFLSAILALFFINALPLFF